MGASISSWCCPEGQNEREEDPNDAYNVVSVNDQAPLISQQAGMDVWNEPASASTAAVGSYGDRHAYGRGQAQPDLLHDAHLPQSSPQLPSSANKTQQMLDVLLQDCSMQMIDCALTSADTDIVVLDSGLVSVHELEERAGGYGKHLSVKADNVTHHVASENEE